MSSSAMIVLQTVVRGLANKGLPTARCVLTLGKTILLKQRQFSTIDRRMSTYITDKAFINGSWISTKNTFTVQNPFSNENIGSSADCDAGLTEEAIKAAVDAFDKWSSSTAKERWAILRRWEALITSEKENLAKLLTLENGKPIAQSVGEITYAAGFVDWYAEEGRRTYGATIPSPSPAKRMMTIKQAIGVTAMITPWNFPSAMITRKACAALAAGCTVVLKPSEETPFSALALAQLAEKAGMPPGVFNVIPTSRANVSEVGKLLCSHPSIAAVSFTGSTAVGKILLHHAADTVKKVSLELGGLAPLIVFDSADVKTAVEGTMASKFRCSGQTCVSANRILVQSGIHDEFVTKLKAAVEKELVMGDGSDSKTTLGPLINNAAVLKVERQVQNAINKGAKIVTGGTRGKLSKNFFEPTVMTGVTPEMECCELETFGPLVPIIKFDTEEEALAIANNSTSGLAGYLFSNDVSQCWRVGEKLETGIVGINEGLMSAPEAPFGGYKQSGLGREGSFYGIDEFMEVKYLCWGVASI